jgi:hypothetical protein
MPYHACHVGIRLFEEASKVVVQLVWQCWGVNPFTTRAARPKTGKQCCQALFSFKSEVYANFINFFSDPVLSESTNLELETLPVELSETTNLELETLPVELFETANLELAALPLELSETTNLELETLPVELFKTANLELEALPVELSETTNLELETLPVELSEMTNL